MNKQEVIVSAIEIGYFRARQEESKAELAEAVKAEFPDLTGAEVMDILTEETARRSAEYKKRLARKVAREQEASAKPVSSGSVHTETHVLPAGNYIITCAQNNTDVHKDFWAALQNFARNTCSTIIVCRSYYNKEGYNHPEHGSDDKGIYFDPALQGYFVDAPCYLGENGPLLVADANVIPTSSSPLSSFENTGGPGDDIIIPAMRVALKMTATLKGGKPKRLFSTGAVTLRNYIRRKAGMIAERLHNFAAVAYIDGDLRHVEMMPNETSFCHYRTEYRADGRILKIRPAVLQLGDIHAEKIDVDCLQAAVDLLAYYNPENLMLHDVLDFSSRNHHNRKDCIFIQEQELAGNSVVQDLNKCANVLETLANVSPDMTTHVIESNHDNALDRWLREADPKLDPTNAEFYYNAMSYVYKYLRENEVYPNMLRACMRGKIPSYDTWGKKFTGGGTILQKIKYHEIDESVIIEGVEHGCHGHQGTNGSRGSPAQFAKLGIPINTGHTHTPSILGQCYTAGVAAPLDMGYNEGPSSWARAAIITYHGGQRAIIFY